MAQQITIPQCAMDTLHYLYPAVDFNQVRFFSGVPWFTSIFSPFTGALVLPAPSGTTDFHVFLGNFDPCLDDDISRLVHEVYHVAQFTSISEGLGYGFTKAAYVQYFRCSVEHGYEDNPWETAAYDYELRYANATAGSVCDCTSGAPLVDEKVFDQIKSHPELVVAVPKTFECGGWWAQTVAILLAAIGSFLLPFGMLLDRFPMRNCQWLVDRQKKCIEELEVIVEECEKEEDQGYDECNDWANQGYNTCSNWASNCCTWKPCSWGCKLLVWVCKAYVWVSNWVCKAYVWIKKIVCVAWRYFSTWVCIAWTIILRLILWCG